MVTFVKFRGQWKCFKGATSIDKAKSFARRLYSQGISCEVWKKNWILVAKYI